MNTQPTPRTDANVKKHNLCRLSGNDLVYADFPKQLERELATVTAQRDEAREHREKLLEILQNVIDADGTPMSIVLAEEALQSLPPKPLSQ